MVKRVSINNGYNTAEVYDENLSIIEAEKERKQYNFNTGDILILTDIEVKYPALLDKDGKPVTETDSEGNEIIVRDFSKRPYFQFYKYGIGKKAVANIKEGEMVDMLENLALKSVNEGIKNKANEILRHCFPYTTIDYGNFTENGQRELCLDAIGYLKDGGLVLRTLPLLDDEGEPIKNLFSWTDKKGQTHEMYIHWYAGTQALGGQIGIKK